MVVTRNNFKQLRKANRIFVKDIALATGLHENTIYNYETGSSKYTDISTRDYNEHLLNKKLEELINERAGSMDDFTIMKKDFLEDLKLYLKESNITLLEFTKMCGIGQNSLYPGCGSTGVLGRSLLNKIMSATGWTIDQIKNHKLEDNKMGYVPSTKTMNEETKAAEAPIEMFTKAEVSKDVLNVKYTFENGEFFREYDILKHVKQPITKEMFMKEVNKND